jgi:hypothetical protein
MEFKIRNAESGDIDAIFALVDEFTTSFKAGRAAFDRIAEQILQDESALLSIAERDDRIVGYCLGFDHYTFYANGRVSWIEEIMVQADMRRARAFYAAYGYEESAIYFRKLL